jgi:hypothetical protein
MAFRHLSDDGKFPPVDILSPAVRDGICRSMLSDLLSPHGFVEITPRRWVDGSDPPKRRLFELQLLKGAGLKACWGYSLDFVPHLSGQSIRWHRSDTTARLDVFIDPISLGQPSWLFGAEILEADLRGLLAVAVPAAQGDWNRGSTYQGALDLIGEIRDKKTNCFDYLNYTQLPIASAFLNAKTGILKRAEQELDEFLDRDRVGPVASAKLRELLRRTSQAS